MKSKEMNAFLRTISPTGLGPNDAVAQRTCATCGKSVGDFRDDLSRKEFTISGMCQACQDSVFGE